MGLKILRPYHTLAQISTALKQYWAAHWRTWFALEKGLSEIVLGGDNKLFSMNADKELQIPAILSNMQDNAFFGICGNRKIFIFVKLKEKLMIFKQEKF